MKIDGKKLLIISAILIASFLLGYVLGRQPKEVVVPPTPVTIIKDSIIHDEIIKENEVIKEKIRYVEKQHDKEVSIILSNTDSANLIYFSNYIRQYQNLQRAAENN